MSVKSQEKNRNKKKKKKKKLTNAWCGGGTFVRN
jgi:hypothetical protein